jgi:hypothetical protein
LAGGALGIIEIGCLFVDVVDQFTYQPNGPDDATAVAYNEDILDEMLSASFPHVDIGEVTHPEVNAALNDYIDSLNTFIGHVNQGEDLSVIANDHAIMAHRGDSGTARRCWIWCDAH